MLDESGVALVERQSYTLCRLEGQAKESLRVRGSHAAKLDRIVSSSGGDPRQRVEDPRRLVPLSPERNGRQIWRVGLQQQPLSRDEPEQVVVSPLVEGHDPAE
jgi:hypothetical protein